MKIPQQYLIEKCVGGGEGRSQEGSEAGYGPCSFPFPYYGFSLDMPHLNIRSELCWGNSCKTVLGDQQIKVLAQNQVSHATIRLGERECGRKQWRLAGLPPSWGNAPFLQHFPWACRLCRQTSNSNTLGNNLKEILWEKPECVFCRLL